MNFNDKAYIYDSISSSQNEGADILINDINEFCKLLGFSNVLDLGCGTGYLTRKLSDSYDHVTGVDTSEKMLQQAADFGGNIEYTLRNAAELNESDEYNLITANSLTYYIADLQAAFKSYFSALKNSGFLAIQSQTEVTPQFWQAFSALENNNYAKSFVDGFTFPANMQHQAALCLYMKEVGFTILLEKTIHFKTICSVEEALNIFKSGTATPLLNQNAYSQPLNNEYKAIFWRTVENSLRSQSVSGQIALDIPRAFIIAVK